MSELENTQDAHGTRRQSARRHRRPAEQRRSAASVYSYIDTGVIGTDTIRVGIVYKIAERDAGRCTPLVDNNPVHNRPPVAQLFTENATGERFTVVVNHFKSKGSCPAPAAPNADQGDGQGCWNAARTQQAQALVSFVNNTVVPAAGDPDVLLVGDFNAYAKEDPIRTIENAGLHEPGRALLRRGRVLVRVRRRSGATSITRWPRRACCRRSRARGDYHINADEPSELDYNTDFKSAGQMVSLYNADEFRISDHDPVVIGLALSPAPQANADHFTVEAGTTLTVGRAQGVLANDTRRTAVDSRPHEHGSRHADAQRRRLVQLHAGTWLLRHRQLRLHGEQRDSGATTLQVFTTNLPPLATVGGVNITAGGFGSSLAPVPGDPSTSSTA